MTKETEHASSNEIFIPEAIQALQSIGHIAEKGGVPAQTLALTHLRASQINGCSVSVDMALRFKKTGGDHGAALRRRCLAGCAIFHPTRSPDEIWNEARKHYDEQALASRLLSIAITNVWNRLDCYGCEPVRE